MRNLLITDGKKTYSIHLDELGVIDTVYSNCRYLTSKHPVVKKLVKYCDGHGRLSYNNLPTGFKST